MQDSFKVEKQTLLVFDFPFFYLIETKIEWKQNKILSILLSHDSIDISCWKILPFYSYNY